MANALIEPIPLHEQFPLAWVVHDHANLGNGSTASRLLRPGLWLARVDGTFDTGNITLEYSEDATTWRSVGVAALVAATAALANAVELRVGTETNFRWTVASGGGSVAIDTWMRWAGW